MTPQPASAPGMRLDWDETLADPGVTFCFQCVAEHKTAFLGRAPLPPVRLAITWVPVPQGPAVVALPICYEHIAIVRSSPLLGADGARVTQIGRLGDQLPRQSGGTVGA